MTVTRIEEDSLGEVEVPASSYWGAQTQRSLVNFPFAQRETMPIAIVHALAIIKLAASRVNRANGLQPAVASAIEKAAREVANGLHDSQFPLAIWQTGSGTQTNMNVNEVIAARANEFLSGQHGGKEPVHPNDHVNMSQSSNDCFPTAIHIAAKRAVVERLLPALASLWHAIEIKAVEWSSIVKIGRTHRQDATPLSLGQEFSAYAHQLDRCRRRLEAVLEQDVAQLAQGGTAVGTGLNAPPGFDVAVVAEIALETGIGFRPAENKFEALASHDPLVQLSATLATLATALNKIANDIRLFGSGPRCGLGELELPANEPGSSIMPGKVNPTQCEMLTMIAAQVIGNHQSVTLGGAQGQFELNVYKPLIASNVLRSIDLLATGMESFAMRCIEGISPNERRIAELLNNSLMLVTALAPELGYDDAAQIAKHALANDLSLKEAAIELRLMDEETFDRLVDPQKMV